jgi:predicted DCC family thiol-disulfide oxidoreductase YuxK
MSKTEKTKIFVDGNCIVCDFEISHYKRIAPELFEIIDISHPDFDATKFRLKKEDVNLNMHAFTPNGELKIGIDAFAHIWSRIQKYNLAAKAIELPVINQLAKMGYFVFARNRHWLPKRKR